MLAAPISFEGRLEQFVGRLHRDYEGKNEVIVYDYIDSHIRVFERQYAKRLRTYKKLGYSLITNPGIEQGRIDRFIYIVKARQEAGLYDEFLATLEAKQFQKLSWDMLSRTPDAFREDHYISVLDKILQELDHKKTTYTVTGNENRELLVFFK